MNCGSLLLLVRVDLLSLELCCRRRCRCRFLGRFGRDTRGVDCTAGQRRLPYVRTERTSANDR
ncbi:MAG TPA: hypothetical protein VG266_07080 [Candidatus Dormibacteraeota bacterium]|nr:hypothetical protein [Candidatus Dormibacteraeota bacterium]